MVFSGVQTIYKAIAILLVGFNSDQVTGLESKSNDLNGGSGVNSSGSEKHDSLAPDHFGYNRVDGPSHWAQVFHDCGGRSQSPISLDTSTALTTHKPHMSWWGYSLKPATMTLVNNGHTGKVVLQGRWEHDLSPYIWDSSHTDDIYVFDHLHFHWGPDDESGSEHTLNNEKFPLEMHVVHYRKDLGSVSAAAHVHGGIKVIAVLFRISQHNNSALNDILDGLDHVHKGKATANIPPFKLSHLVPDFSKQFLEYNGSLTTPPCSESVTWVVYSRASAVSQQQFDFDKDGGNQRPSDGVETPTWRVGVEQSVVACGEDKSTLNSKIIVAVPDVNAKAKPIPAGYELFPGVGYYKFHPDAANWAGARQVCAEEGAHLIVINSEYEANVVKQLFTRFPKEKITNYDSTLYQWSWVGVYEQGANGQYFTIQGQTLNQTGFSRWHPGQPDGGGSDDCILAYALGAGHNDFGCSYRAAYICEY